MASLLKSASTLPTLNATEPAALGGSTPLPDGLLTGELMEEAYSFVHPSRHPDPRSLPLVDWQENCSAYTRTWWSAQN